MHDVIIIGREQVDIVLNRTLSHHGVKGMHWGIKNGPPYPLSESSKVHFKLPKMSLDEYIRAIELWKDNKEIEPTNHSKNRIYSHISSNASTKEKESAIISCRIDDMDYIVINKGHEQYKVISECHSERPNGRPKDIIDDVLSTLFGYDWEKYDE